MPTVVAGKVTVLEVGLASIVAPLPSNVTVVVHLA